MKRGKAMRPYRHFTTAIAAAICALPLSSSASEIPARHDQQLQMLLDKQELYELNVRYARSVDRKNLDDLLSLYHSDAIHDHGGMFKGSPAQFIAWLKTTMIEIETQHFVGNSLFKIDGNFAVGEIYTVNFHHLSKQSANYIAGGRYLDEYIKTDGKWRFKSRLRVLDWSEERPSVAGKTAASLVRGDRGEADPSRRLKGL
jgi:3-phenylpropionate/cinnamic acid dioxygenase small subunit